ncbi:hypothetical protein FN846DRAFT_821451 [Sphaerosporella brunnea]|uniref:MARVEL domain-containing protein n=1 Tax=Sphaerosporella brunnea TaxID=1250544 RepID=A0A5J5EBY1_9PEZI|nr:hypothetical protein FN846DRAFT_821451 [Sphaerosporella brunnea]
MFALKSFWSWFFLLSVFSFWVGFVAVAGWRESPLPEAITEWVVFFAIMAFLCVFFLFGMALVLVRFSSPSPGIHFFCALLDTGGKCF